MGYKHSAPTELRQISQSNFQTCSKNKNMEWMFAEPKNVAVFTSSHVMRDGKPILYVSHDAEDGAWQFHSGDVVSEEEAMIVALDEVVEFDLSISELADLPLGWCARRKSQSLDWMRLPKSKNKV